MRKILYLTFLFFFINAFILNFFFSQLDARVLHYNGDTDHSMHFIVALFFTFIIYILSIIVVFIEYRMEFAYKNVIAFLAYTNVLLQFYLTAFCEYRLFSSPERFDKLSITIILTYFVSELVFTLYVINKLYKSKEEE